MLRNLFFILVGFLIGVFLASSLSWRDVDWNRLKGDPWQELMRLRAIISEKPEKEIHSATVTKVLDGDTLIIEGGKEVKLLGIDADEIDEPCFDQAKNRLSELASGKEATLIRDLNDKDNYGRLLRYLQVNGVDVNVQMVKEGLVSLKITDNVTLYKNDLVFAEQYAKNKSAGCKWGVD